MEAKTAEKSTMKMFARMIVFTALLAGLSVLFFVLSDQLFSEWCYAAAVTMLTLFYHFAMRLIVGETITYLYRDKDFPQDRLGFRLYAFERELYRKLKVTEWKTHVITAKPEQFDLKLVTPKDLLHNVMQAELVHRTIMLLSFVPLLLVIPFGAPWVFITTSVAACLLDGMFVIIQRYNRPTVQRYLELMRRREERKRASLP